jgi:hypothetical protein
MPLAVSSFWSKAVTLSGTSWTFSGRRVEVTMTSPTSAASLCSAVWSVAWAATCVANDTNATAQADASRPAFMTFLPE